MPIKTLEYMQIYTDYLLPILPRMPESDETMFHQDKKESYFEEPFDELNTPLVTLNEMLQGHRDVFQTYFHETVKIDMPEHTGGFNKIMVFIRRNSKRIRDVEAETKRVSDYVYPVV